MVASSLVTRRVAVALAAPVALLLQCLLPLPSQFWLIALRATPQSRATTTQCVPVPGEQVDSSGQLPGGLDLVNGESQRFLGRCWQQWWGCYRGL